MEAEVFAYERAETGGNEAGIRILRCYSYDEQVEIPESLMGEPVVELAPYMFSEHMDRAAFQRSIDAGSVKFADRDGLACDKANLPPELCGGKLGIVGLPKFLKKIGRYAFYNCSNLRKIEFYSMISDLGPGLFTGCHHVEALTVQNTETRTACFRQILLDLAEELRVDYYENGELAKLVFPEYFEEGGEDTPAKNTKITYHGSGLHFRNCFKDNAFQFRWYDERFIKALSWEREELAIEMALGRLCYPASLSDWAKENYEAYVKEHFLETGKWLLERKEKQGFRWLLEQEVFREAATEAVLETFVEIARVGKEMEAVSMLMNLKRRLYPPKAKKFEL